MKIFYLCPTGLHTAMAAAGLHIGLLRDDSPPKGKELQKLIDDYRRLDYRIGKPLTIGVDSAGNEIFTVGVGSAHKIMKKALTDVFKKIYRVSAEEYLVVDTAKYTNVWINTGSFFSMRMNMPSIGEKLCAYGIKKVYSDIRGIVEQVKKT